MGNTQLAPESAALEACEIDLTEEEIRQALADARQRKQQQRYTEEYWKRVREPKMPLKVDRAGMWQMALNQFTALSGGRQFIVDEHNAALVELLLDYFMQNEKFEERAKQHFQPEGADYVYSLKKGLMIVGGVGCGKTTLMHMFVDNPLQMYFLRSCRTVADEYTRKDGGGYQAIEKYWYEHYNPGMASNPFHHKSTGICFDDLGTEETAKHMGNQKNVMAEIIMNRYDRISALAHKTHITTNLIAADIVDTYGKRCASRMREMFNIIQLPGKQPDRRR